MHKLAAILLSPLWLLTQVVCLVSLWARRAVCKHPPGCAASTCVVGGFGNPIFIRRCIRCGAEVSL